MSLSCAHLNIPRNHTLCRIVSIMWSVVFAFLFSLIVVPLTQASSPRVGSMEEEFLQAARLGDEEKVLSLLNQGISINVQNKYGWNALGYAVSKGHYQVARILLERGTNPNEASITGMTPLMIAAMEGNIDGVKLLLNFNADPNAKGQVAKTALMNASARGHIEVAKLLLQHGADINVHEDANGQTALIHAAKRGYLAITHQLLLAGADSRAKDAQGRSALDLARGNSRDQIVAQLTGAPSPDIGDEAVALPAPQPRL